MPILPVARNTNYTSASPVNSQDLNDLQDCVIGRKKPPWTRIFWPKIIFPGPFTQTLDGLFPSLLASVSTGNAGLFEIPCEEGDRITGFAYTASGNSSADATLAVCYAPTMPDFYNPVYVSKVVDANRSAAWAAVPMSPFTPQIIAPGGGLYFAVSVDQPGYRLGILRAKFDRL